MKFIISNRYLISLIAIIFIIAYLFWGPLFPWNPFKIGYQKIISSKATVYINNMTKKDSVVFRIDKILIEEEKFHDLTYLDQFKIIILNQDSNMKRYLPWLKGSGYSVSLGIANVIYIGPTARKSPDGIERYLKHELSHLLIAQNTTFGKGKLIHEQAWLAEGIAEYFSGHSFYTKKEFIELCKQNNIQFTSLFEQSPQNMSFTELTFKYTYYRFFIEFLINRYGIDKLQLYLSKYKDKPENYEQFFNVIYSKQLNEILKLYYSTLIKF
jgi:hypothetical protein